MKCLIIAAGCSPDKNLLEKESQNADIIICADGGANHLFSSSGSYLLPQDILPDFIIGDLDSITEMALTFFKFKQIPFETHPKAKDHTDTHLALEKAINLGSKEVTFLACLGDRIDHVLANFGLLALCLDKKIDACLKDERSNIYLFDRSFKLFGKKNNVFSLQAYGGEVKDLNIEGSKFELKNYALRMGDNLTLSNEILSDKREVTIKFSSGELLLICSNSIKIIKSNFSSLH